MLKALRPDRIGPYVVILALVSIVIFSQSCNKDELIITDTSSDTTVVCSPADSQVVNFNPVEVPYDSLSSYNFFEGELKDQQPIASVIPFEPITTLFTDYAHKYRFIWMPDSVSATYNSDHQILDFPNGTVLIKTFYYDHVQPENATKLIETRLLFMVNDSWRFANYIWNSDQTEATLDMVGSYVDLDWVDDNGTPRNTTYRVPSEAECLNCHKVNLEAIPIGPKPQNLNKTYVYDDGPMNQLDKLQQVGYLSGNIPTSIETVVDWQDELQPIQDRVRAYLDINCAHCHAETGHCNYRPPRFAWNETSQEENIGICVEPDETPLPQYTHIVSRGNIERSVMHFRLNTTDETVRMPLLGRTLIHEEAVLLIEQWINSLDPPCN